MSSYRTDQDNNCEYIGKINGEELNGWNWMPPVSLNRATRKMLQEESLQYIQVTGGSQTNEIWLSIIAEP